MSQNVGEARKEGAREAMEMAEAARQKQWEHPSFLAGLFMGRFQPELFFPFPQQDDEDRRVGDAFLARLEAFLKEKVDPDRIDETRDVPPEVIQGLIELGCFRMKIPAEYGGLGLSQTNYNRAIAMVASYCGSTAVWLSAHQSIGVPQPLKLFGTEEQKKKFMPRLAQGAISAFALTEPGVGSDPATMQTTATPTEDGKFYILEGEKLWCTNGPVADILIVMARTPSLWVGGRERKQITAFIVESSMPGFEVAHRCDFMGIRGIQNGLLRFHGVRVPRENILWGEGKGLKVALITLNTGRLTLPAACTGMAKRCLSIVRDWASERVQWGAPIGHHEAVAAKIGSIAATTFAMDSLTWLTSALADRGGFDIRLEAAMAKLFCSEAAWSIADQTVQIRGGRGYETAPSLRARGEKPYPVERILREARINLIIEGASEIMRLFIAREALDGHLRVAGDLLKPELVWKQKAACATRAALFYAHWYPRQWLPSTPWRRFVSHEPFAHQLRYVARTCARLARSTFHAMIRHQARLEKKQALLGRLVDIGGDLFAMTACLARAESLLRQNPGDSTPRDLAEIFCCHARRRIDAAFRCLFNSDDAGTYRLARRVLGGEMTWLEEGIVRADFSARPAAPSAEPHAETAPTAPEAAAAAVHS
ncbi:MAG: acyl-CoA dehydrogenase family protein [Planctomycetes bacterium]|nr:acyl-CoA dehydrogenase family protein [Planctomycetota bacterium]